MADYHPLPVTLSLPNEHFFPRRSAPRANHGCSRCKAKPAQAGDIYSRPSEQMPETTCRLDTCGFHKKDRQQAQKPSHNIISHLSSTNNHRVHHVAQQVYNPSCLVSRHCIWPIHRPLLNVGLWRSRKTVSKRLPLRPLSEF